MGQDNGWLPETPGTLVVLTDPPGKRVEGFLEQVDAGLGIAWIRERDTGEQRMLTPRRLPPHRARLNPGLQEPPARGWIQGRRKAVRYAWQRLVGPPAAGGGNAVALVFRP